MKRRDFITALLSGLISLAAGKEVRSRMSNPGNKAKVSLVKTSDRTEGIKRAIDLLGINPVKGKEVLLKPNFNTADEYPGSTHNDTLIRLILKLKEMGAKKITIGERSGPPDTANVMKEKGIYDICKEHDIGLINFEDLPDDQWKRIQPDGSHWRNGFDIAKPVLESECVVTTCCLKTHGFGGVFTMSLKLSIGITHKRNMTELHTSFLSMRKMIAEVNTSYDPALILMDGIEAFTSGGPAKGKKAKPDVIIAGTDRIAIDAVGVAILKELGSKKEIMEKRIFEQEQIARAVELGLGVERPDKIDIITDSDAGKVYADKLNEILMKG
ncbi:MAG: DUF362 domain-containing protein [Thermodesulfovibrionales bacterium]